MAEHDLEGYRIDRYIPWKCDHCGTPVLVNDYGQSRPHEKWHGGPGPCDTTQSAHKFRPSGA
jgi:hypothetical protein